MLSQKGPLMKQYSSVIILGNCDGIVMNSDNKVEHCDGTIGQSNDTMGISPFCIMLGRPETKTTHCILVVQYGTLTAELGASVVEEDSVLTNENIDTN